MKTPFWNAEYAEKYAEDAEKYAEDAKKICKHYAEYAKKIATLIWNTQNRDMFVFCVFCIRSHSPLC
jgi:hypothetical protein